MFVCEYECDKGFVWCTFWCSFIWSKQKWEIRSSLWNVLDSDVHICTSEHSEKWHKFVNVKCEWMTVSEWIKQHPGGREGCVEVVSCIKNERSVHIYFMERFLEIGVMIFM